MRTKKIMSCQENFCITNGGLTRVAFVVLCLAFWPALCLADAGGLDPTFGNGGKVTTNFFGPSQDEARDVIAIQADGKIVVVGITINVGGSDFALVRYNADGTFDTSFGINGRVTTDFAASSGEATAVAIQTDGKIVVAGNVSILSGTGPDFALARYNPDGTLDIGFGTNGRVTTDFASSADQAYSVATQADGKIVVAGFATNSGTASDFALARYNPNGSLDSNFGTSGLVTTDHASNTNTARSIAIQPDGKIVAAGFTAAGFDFMLTRYNLDGSLDSDFGTGGLVITTFSLATNGVTSLAIQSDNRIVTVGWTFGGSPTFHDFALARYNLDGTLDTSFGPDGRVTTDLTGSSDVASSVALESNGKIIVAGVAGAFGIKSDFAVVRYNDNGSLDTSFGTDGKIITDFLGPANDTAQNIIVVQADGKILVAGWSISVTGSTDFAIARYNSDGSLDEGFGTGGLVTSDFGAGFDDRAFSLTLQADGKIVVAGWTFRSDTRSDFALARYNPDGTLDVSFDGDGLLTTDFGSGFDDQAFSVALQADGKIVVAGWTFRSGTSIDFALARYNPNGTLDISFDGDGLLTTDFASSSDEASSIATQADNKIVVAGRTFRTGTRYDFALARYNPDGTLDTSFAGDGLLTTDFGSGFDEQAFSVALQADGKIVVAGRTFVSGTGLDFALVRYNPDGTLNTIFGINGRVTTDFASSNDEAFSVVIQADGKIIVAGVTCGFGSPTGCNFALARYEGLNTPQEEVELLITQVEDLVTSGVLNNGQGNSLLAKLQAALQQIDNGNTTAAINQLNAFINQIQAFINSGELSQAEGQPLISVVNNLINKLSGTAKQAMAGQVQEPAQPKTFALEQNYPNPFNPATEIRFQLPEANLIVVKIFNTVGEEIRTLMEGQYEAGHHLVRWDGKDNNGNTVASGVYLYQLRAENFSEVKKLSLLR